MNGAGCTCCLVASSPDWDCSAWTPAQINLGSSQGGQQGTSSHLQQQPQTKPTLYLKQMHQNSEYIGFTAGEQGGGKRPGENQMLLQSFGISSARNLCGTMRLKWLRPSPADC